MLAPKETLSICLIFLSLPLECRWITSMRHYAPLCPVSTVLGMRPRACALGLPHLKDKTQVGTRQVAQLVLPNGKLSFILAQLLGTYKGVGLFE